MPCPFRLRVLLVPSRIYLAPWSRPTRRAGANSCVANYQSHADTISGRDQPENNRLEGSGRTLTMNGPKYGSRSCVLAAVVPVLLAAVNEDRYDEVYGGQSNH